jgi:hypothetical protein
MEKLFYHLLDLSDLKRFILLTSCGSKISYQNFRFALARDVIQDWERVPEPETASWGRQTPSTSHLTQLDNTVNTGLWNENTFGIMCVLQKTKKQGQNSSV